MFGVQPGGLISASPMVNTEPGLVPFAFAFEGDGQVAVADAGNNAVQTLRLGPGRRVVADLLGRDRADGHLLGGRGWPAPVRR